MIKFMFIHLYKRPLLIIITLGAGNHRNNVGKITHLLHGNGTVTLFQRCLIRYSSQYVIRFPKYTNSVIMLKSCYALITDEQCKALLNYITIL